MHQTLPAETTEWLAGFRGKVVRERQILATLIEWGFANAAFDIHKDIELHLKNAQQFHEAPGRSRGHDLSHLLGKKIREILRSHYLDGLAFPQAQPNQQSLQGAYLSGFEEQAARLVHLYSLDRGETALSADEQAA